MSEKLLDFGRTYNLLKKKYPDAHCALNFKNPFELLIATILSAQCTDIRVNIVTAVLFKKYKNATALAKANLHEIENIIHSTGFFKNKAKNIKGCSQMLVKKFNNEVPEDLEKLVQLPGVGRKTANVVLGNAFGISSGVVVDTHVMRLAERFGWINSGLNPVQIELILNDICPQKNWVMLSHYLIAHGRSICLARSPKCKVCFLMKDCPSNKNSIS